MREVEVKIIEIDHEKVETKLKSMGATKTFDGDEETIFFDFSGNPIAEAGNLLRLRKIENKSTLTFKKFIGNESAKVREEYEVSISDFETMRIILECLGLASNLGMKKHRTSYVLKDGVSVDTDKYHEDFSHIPELMEIEAKDIPTIYANAKLLGYNQEDCKPWTTHNLIDYYSKKEKECERRIER